jgi:hypothetical protein
MLQGFTQIVDYAGLFPPASCGMDEAVRHYASYLDSDDRWMLGRFVVSAARLAELGESLQRLALPPGGTRPWELTVVLGADGVGDRQRIDEFVATHGARAQVRAVEVKVASVADVATLAGWLPADVERYLEVPHREEYHELLAAIHAAGMAAKLRTGGVTPDLFPSVTQVRAFLQAAVALGVPFKATAGLHHPFGGSHPLTYAPDSARHGMFGFVNVLLATALLRVGVTEEVVDALLLEADPAAFTRSDDGWSWRGHEVSAAELTAARDAFRGFGSCSFREPVDELALEGRPA